jgi:hypothetical protein
VTPIEIALNGFQYGFAFAAFLAGFWAINAIWKAFLGGDGTD